MMDKGCCTSEDYMLEESDNVIKDDNKISDLFNYFLSTVYYG